MLDQSRIVISDGATVFEGRDAVLCYQAIVIAKALDLYAKEGIMAFGPRRRPKHLMMAASKLTGQQFKARDYAKAAQALRNWADLMKSGLPIEHISNG